MAKTDCCRLLHKWSKWSEPFQIEVAWINKATSRQSPWAEVSAQKRTCARCNKMEQRNVVS